MNQLTRTELREAQEHVLEYGQVRLRVDKFALTSNNITCAAFGDAMNYWGFYPADPGWGRIPVWDFGTVVESQHAGVSVGKKFYG